MTTERIVIVGGCRVGKSTLASELSAQTGAPVFCGDPSDKAKEQRAGVTYLPNGIPIAGDDGAAQWIVEHWFTMPGPWILEGWVMARALRRWVSADPWREPRTGDPFIKPPVDRIIVLDRPGFGILKPGQRSMIKAVMTVWNEVAHCFEPIVEYR